jgi:hypothetical protein
MSEGFFAIELGHYGFMLDTNWAYVSLSWNLVGVSALCVIIYKIIKRKKNK